QEDAGLRLSASEHALDLWKADEGIHHGRRSAGCEEVEIATGLEAATETPDGRDRGVGIAGPQRGDQAVGRFGDFGREPPARIAAAILDRAQDQRFLLRA